ncbi:unnamed protein product [Mycena citricolor]|uniref:Uncharacterized protein n=1 Tax=Mycena citricolor TaxID=2018698 RepID=A0AAD2HGD8_9AGAR|nr:unnamed protein product [Mycena citricolor]
MMFASLLVLALVATVANAHLAAFAKGMYALGGVSGQNDLNQEDVVYPLFQLPKSQWWFHHVNGVDNFPPAPGDFLELPAGGSFTVEIASNRGETSLSFGGKFASDWPDGKTYPENYNVDTCIISPNMHTQNQSMAAGTAFAISYTSDIKAVTEDNLAVFTVRYHTPWKRVTSYDVPADLPACPKGGCICAWGWVPNGCGQPNMYMLPYRCTVTGASSTKAVGTPQPPVWCQDDPSSCTKGPKQMIYWNQADGNNIEVSGYDNAGEFKSPAYNANCGFPDGAQNDIFTGGSSSSSGTSPKAGTTARVQAASTATTRTTSTTSTTSTKATKATTTSTPTTTSSTKTVTSSATSSASHVPTCKPRRNRRRSALAGHRRRGSHSF